jgi:hypothetical protein
MMNDSHDHIEDNIARLIQAGFGGESRPDPCVHARTFKFLANHLRKRPSSVVFPERILIALVGVLIFLTAWLIAQVDWTGIRLNARLLYFVIASAVFVNLLFIPFTILIIFRRRRYV